MRVFTVDASRTTPSPLVLFDRDGTLVEDVPYNGDPGQVRPVPGAAAALARLRADGARVGVVTNQSGVGQGLLATEDVQRVNARIDELIGPFDTWQVCTHRAEDGCPCRKPAPGMVHAAAAAVGVPVHLSVVIGDIGSDVHAALAAGARAVLVPTEQTRAEEVTEARELADVAVAGDLQEAVDLVLAARSALRRGEPRPSAPATHAGGGRR